MSTLGGAWRTRSPLSCRVDAIGGRMLRPARPSGAAEADADGAAVGRGESAPRPRGETVAGVASRLPAADERRRPPQIADARLPTVQVVVVPAPVARVGRELAAAPDVVANDISAGPLSRVRLRDADSAADERVVCDEPAAPAE